MTGKQIQILRTKQPKKSKDGGRESTVVLQSSMMRKSLTIELFYEFLMISFSMQQLIEETEKADDDKKKKLVEESGLTGRHGKNDLVDI